MIRKEVYVIVIIIRRYKVVIIWDVGPIMRGIDRDHHTKNMWLSYEDIMWLSYGNK